MGATLIAASVVVLVIGMAWLNRSPKREHLATPTVDGVTLPTDRDGNAVDIPPSQPAVAVSFGGGGEILRPDPVRARIVDESGQEVIVPLSPNTTVDTVTGAIVDKSTTTTIRPGTTATTRRTTTTTRGSTTPTTQPTTSTTTGSTTTTTAPTTTESTTTTTEPPPTTPDPTDPDPDPTLAGFLAGLLP